MSTVAEKLAYLARTKALIREALMEKGAEITESTPFRAYPEHISRLPASGGGCCNFMTTLEVNYGTLECAVERTQ